MEISYSRNLNGSRMVIRHTNKGAEWERKMLLCNPPEGVIAPDYVCENGEEVLWYDITGRQALDVWLDTGEVDYEMLRRICGAVLAAAEQLERLLLPPDAILLKPECIFLDHAKEDIKVCCCLGHQRAIEESFHEFMQYLLKKLNHKDPAAVEAGYRLFEETARGAYSMKEIPRLLSAGNLQSERTEAFREEEELPLDFVNEKREEQKILTAGWRIAPKKSRKKGEQMKGGKRKEEKRKEEKRKGGTFLDRMQKSFAGKREDILQKFTKKKPQEEEFVFEPEEENEARKPRPTVLLSEISHKPQGILKYEGDGDCADMKIEGSAYIIGSDAACGGRILKDTISRRHAKITRKEDVYFIEDLNSSNGTFVGGELLNCRVKMSLQYNETVMFADEKFRFL